MGGSGLGGAPTGAVCRGTFSRRRFLCSLSFLLVFSTISPAWGVDSCFAWLARAVNPSYALPPVEKRPLESFEQLEFASYNVLNLNEFVGKYRPKQKGEWRSKQIKAGGQKSERHRREMADILLDHQAKFIVLQEVEGQRAADSFNRYFLNGEYQIFFRRGNDPRGIEVAMLVHRSLPFRYEYRSYARETWNDPQAGGRRSTLFSRDLPALIVRSEETDRPLFILLGGHYKSKRDRSGDPTSKNLAAAQFKRTAEIVERLRKEFPGVPVILAADRNRDPVEDPEPRVLETRGKLSDSFDVIRPPLKPEERITHTYHPTDGPTVRSQIDAIMVSEELVPAVDEAYVQPYLDEQGNPLPPPDTFAQRKRQPSDHRPVFMKLNVPELLKVWRRPR